MSRWKKILLLVTIIFGINWYTTYNLRHYVVYYAQNAFNNDIDVVAYYLIKELKDIPLYFSESPKFIFQYRVRGLPIIWRKDVKMALMLDNEGYDFDLADKYYNYDKFGNFIDDFYSKDDDDLTYEDKIELSKIKEVLLQPILDIQPKPAINLQWLFDFLNKDMIDEYNSRKKNISQ